MMAFQETSEDAICTSEETLVEKTKSRKLVVEDIQIDSEILLYKSEPTNEPFSKFQLDKVESEHEIDKFSVKYFLWLYLRHLNSFSQTFPIFSGWLLSLRTRQLQTNSAKLSKTIETYLPPLTTKVTDPITIYRYMTHLQDIAAEMNMEYVNITLDIGAAINAYKILWSHPDIFANIVIHPGDFHFLKENFKVIGCFISNSGFEDII